MANRIPKLTKRSVDALKPNGSDTLYWDSELTGFGIRIRVSGRKTYVLQTRIGGRQRWYTIGKHGPLTPDEARAIALEYRRAVETYINPAIGRMRVSEVDRKDIAALHHGMRNTPYKANRTLAVLSKMFNLAEVWEWRTDGSNPCRHVELRLRNFAYLSGRYV